MYWSGGDSRSHTWRTWASLRARRGVCQASFPEERFAVALARPSLISGAERSVQLLPDRRALDPHVFRQAVLVRRVILALDQRLQVFAALLRDAEAVLGDVVA